MADFSVYLLVAASRRTGANSYEDVVKMAFGAVAQVFTLILLVLLIVLAIVAYCVLTNGKTRKEERKCPTRFVNQLPRIAQPFTTPN